MKSFLDGLRNRHSLRLTERLSPPEEYEESLRLSSMKPFLFFT